MSKPFLEQVHCPVCDSMQTSITWSEIDAAADPEARDRLFTGEINAFDCHTCGYAGQIVAPLLYFDSVRAFSVQYYPEDLLDDDEWLAQQAASEASRSGIALGSTAMWQQPAYLVHPHVVFDLDEMLRFIVFRERLWDLQHTPDE